MVRSRSSSPHPTQIASVNIVFTPSPTGVQKARRIVAASAQARGSAYQVDGRMVDALVAKAAQRTVTLAERKAA